MHASAHTIMSSVIVIIVLEHNATHATTTATLSRRLAFLHTLALPHNPVETCPPAGASEREIERVAAGAV